MRELAPGGASLVRVRGLDPGQLTEGTRERRPVTVVVPVFNGGAAVARCLDSLERFTSAARLVVIDDASTDPDVVADLDRRAAAGSLELVRHEHNLGYTRTANQALSLDDDADIVLLNSDTEVGPGWLSGLVTVARSQPGVATVSALSDNAGAMAMPSAGVANEWAAHLSWSEIARAVARLDTPWSIPVPTGHGFCMLITREAIDALEGFDEAAFPRGYGEENDFCMRALERGMVNLIAPRVFVRHERSQSFGSEREELIKEGRKAVDARHPGYTAAIRFWLGGQQMADLRRQFEDLRTSLQSVSAVLPRRLYVLHRAGGGTPATNLDLMTALSAHQESYLLESLSGKALELARVTERGAIPVVRWTADSPFAVTDTWRQDYAEVVVAILLRLGIELVHVRHLINHPLTTLPDVTARLGVPLVISTHDFYLSCPTVHLLDDQDRFCGGTCTAGMGTCRLPTPFVQEVPTLKHTWIHEWRRRVSNVLDAASVVVATTQSARNVMAASYPEHVDRMRVVEHGRDLDKNFAHLRPEGTPRLPGPLRILAVANWDPHKGTEYLRAMAAATAPRVEWHVMGQRSELLSDVATVHGPFARESLRRLVSEIDPDLAALVSIWPETYSHTLSEAWAFGLPVIATDIGAIAERIRAHGGGVLVPVDDPERAAKVVLDLVAEPGSVQALRSNVPRAAVRSRAAMAEDYRAMYDEVSAGGARGTGLKVGYVVHGTLGSHPGSAHVRVLRRLANAAADRRILQRQVTGGQLAREGASADLDVVLVQRDALDHDVDEVVSALCASGTRLVVELDDDLLHADASGRMLLDPEQFAVRRDSLTSLVEHADAVITSTPVVASRLADHASGASVVIPNELDPRLWLRDVPTDPAPARDELRVLYMGSRTHLDDLLILRDVFRDLSDDVGRKVVLEVAGVADRFDGDGWFKRLRIPSEMRNYPQFVRWLLVHRPRWHAAVAPLVDAEFNQAKSDLKLLEYAMLGLPVVASNVGPYQDASQLALLTSNDPLAWRQALQDTLTDVDAATERARRARSQVIDNRLLTPANVERWLQLLRPTAAEAQRE